MATPARRACFGLLATHTVGSLGFTWMATPTISGTGREPRIALAVDLERTRPGPASVADIAIALDVLTAIITDYRERETGPLHVDGAHADDAIWALAVLEHDDAPLIVSAGNDGALRSWQVDGTLGPLRIDDAHADAIWALAVLEHDGEPLIVSGDGEGAIRSWRVDGTPGPPQRPQRLDPPACGRLSRLQTADRQRWRRRGDSQLAARRQPGPLRLPAPTETGSVPSESWTRTANR